MHKKYDFIFLFAWLLLEAGCAAQPRITETSEIGKSVKGTPIIVTRVGTGGALAICIFGAIHGDEGNTSQLVEQLEKEYVKNPDLVPRDIRLYFLPAINPDGLEKKTRRNHHNVDLNRNFPTPNWKKDALSPGKVLIGSGGPSPGSEPEVAGLTKWLVSKVKKEVETVWVITYHSAYPQTGAVQAGYIKYASPEKESDRIANAIAELTGYKYLETWVTDAQLTGEFINWCEVEGMRGVDIELPDYNPPDTVRPGAHATMYELHSAAIRKLLRFASAPLGK